MYYIWIKKTTKKKTLELGHRSWLKANILIKFNTLVSFTHIFTLLQFFLPLPAAYFVLFIASVFPGKKKRRKEVLKEKTKYKTYAWSTILVTHYIQ